MAFIVLRSLGGYVDDGTSAKEPFLWLAYS